MIKLFFINKSQYMLLKMQVIGNLGKDATIKDYNGKKVINFSVAHTEKYKNAQGVATEKTTWVECSMWEKGAVAPYLKKGTLVHVEGTPSSNAFLNKQNEPSSSLRLSVFGLQLLGGNKEAGSPSPTDTAPVATPVAAPANGEPEDDLPF